MTLTADEAAALQYRLDQEAGARARLARYLALHGSATAYAALLAAWKPLQRDPGWDAPRYLTEEEDDALN